MKTNPFDPELLRKAVVNWDEHVGKQFMVKKLVDENGTLYFCHTEDSKMIVLEYIEPQNKTVTNRASKH